MTEAKTHSVAVSSVATTAANVERNTKHIRTDTAKIDTVLEEIHALRFQLQNKEQKQNANIVLDRFLAESCSYAESIYNPTSTLR